MERMPRNNSENNNQSTSFDILATRREVDRSFEQSEVYRSTELLTRFGFLRNMRNLNLYHGRTSTGNESEPWSVNPALDNSGNNTGNKNINKVPALNTAKYSTAAHFAQARAQQNGGRSEIHRITSDNPDARIIDKSFDWSQYSEDQKYIVKNAIAKTLPNLLEGLTLSFDDRKVGLGTLHHISEFHGEKDYRFLFEGDANELAKKMGISRSAAETIGAARNTNMLLKNLPEESISRLLSAYRDKKDYLDMDLDFVGRQRIPISREYIGAWMKKMDVVGMRTKVNSATLGHKDINNYLLFELDDINTPEALEKRREERNRIMGRIAIKNAELMYDGIVNTKVMDLIKNDTYAKPEQIVKAAMRTPGFKELFEGDAGVWEKFSVQQHTETVLRVFDENYADKLPATILPLMRTALLVHDIGKAEAAANHDKRNQKRYNVPRARDFMRLNGIDDKTQNLIIAMIGDGADLTTNWAVRHFEGAEKTLDIFCRKTMIDYLGNNASEQDVAGFKNLLLTLQTCDSAAYTDMALTRSKDGQYIYRNYPEFNGSFKHKAGLNNRKLELKTEGDQKAAFY